MGLPDLLHRGATARVLREGSLVAVPRRVGDAEIAWWIRRWAPDAQLAPDGRFLFGRSLQLLGPLDVGRAIELPAGALTVYAVVHRRDRPMYEFDADALAAGLARRLGGWYRQQADSEWTSGDAQAPIPVLYTPAPLTSAEEILRTLGGDFRVEALFQDGYSLTSDAVCVRAGTAEAALVTYPLIARQPWFTTWAGTAEYRVETLRPGADEAAAAVARTMLSALDPALMLDQTGFPH